MWFIGVEVEQETSAPPPKKNPRSAPVVATQRTLYNALKIPDRYFNGFFNTPRWVRTAVIT